MKENIKTIFFIRHGETTGDLENRWGGSYDDHLTPQGIKEAKELSEILSTENIEYIFSSSLARANETADIINITGVPVEINKHFNERDGLMHLTGMKKDEAEKLYPDLVLLLKDYHGVVPGGESYLNFSNRVKQGLFEIVLNSIHQRIAIVSHGGPLSVLFREIFKKGEIKYQNCSFVKFEYDTDNFSVISTKGIMLV